ncbi:MAG: hypothetical protein QGH74_08785 [Candidatus Brocadiia bacterium]|nr:hypothetical protein [Candidatus Brocadiia bacterium]
MSESEHDRCPRPAAVYIEDGLILASIACLFVLGIFYRDRWWGQLGMAPALAAMVVVGVRRLTRVRRAFRDRD